LLSNAHSIDLTIYFGENDNDVGFVMGLSCVKGMKKIFLLLSNLPMFSAFVLRPSLLAIPK